MFELTHKHLDLITADVSRADISYSHLKYDLIDHICCDLEKEMSEGLPFEKAYAMVRKRIGIRGLQQIQEDTLLLIDKKYRIMKNTMKTSGVIATILMAFGSLFKIEHWPGASVMLVLGFFLLCIVFLPSAVYVSYREVSNRKKLVTHLSGFLAAFLFAVSFLFKIQHWPGTPILMLAASVIAGLVFIPAFFINQLKESPKNQIISYIFGFMGSVIYLAGFLFKVNHWPGAAIFMLSGSLFLIFIAFPLFIVSHYKNYEHVSSRFIFLTFAVVWFILPTALIALNVSNDSIAGLKENATNKEYSVRYLSSKNNILISTLKSGTSTESIKTKEIAETVKKNTDQLVDYIQSIKIKMISLAKGITISPNQAIQVEDIDGSYTDASEQVLLKEGEANHLKEKLESYKQKTLHIPEVDLNSARLISDVLRIFPTNEMADPNIIWGHFYLISTLNKLSNIQESVLTAEKIVFRCLRKRSEAKQ